MKPGLKSVGHEEKNQRDGPPEHYPDDVEKRLSHMIAKEIEKAREGVDTDEEIS